MNRSVMLFPFHRLLTSGELTPRELVHTLRDAGAAAIEPMLSWIDADPETWETFRDETLRAGLTFSCLDIGANLVGTNAADRAAALDTVRRGVMIAADLPGCDRVLVAGSRPDPALGEDRSRQVYGRALGEAIDRTRDAGIMITIEDFGVYPRFAAASRHCLEVLAAAARDDLGFTFDNGNFLLADEPPTAAYAAVKQCIHHVHIKDFQRRPPDESPALTSPAGVGYRECAIGTGEGQVQECLELLKGDGYAGWLSIEVGGQSPLENACRGIEFIAAHWN